MTISLGGRGRRGAIGCSLLGAALATMVPTVRGAGNGPVENFAPQGAMQADLNAGGHNISNAGTVTATTVSAGNVAVSGTLTAPSFALPFTSVTGTPTTAAGYGIGDVYNKSTSDTRYAPASGSTNYAATGDARFPAAVTGIRLGHGAGGTDTGLTLGSGLTLNGSTLSANVSGTGGGTVTSVGLALPGIFSVSNSPVTTAGTLTGTLTSEGANTFFAAPDGAAGTPAFRLIVPGDLAALYANANAFTAKQTITTGTGTPTTYAPPASLLVNDLVTTDVTSATGSSVFVTDITPPDASFPGGFINVNNALFTHNSIPMNGNAIILYRATSTNRGSANISGIEAYETHIGNQSLEQSGTAANVGSLKHFHAESPDLGSASDTVTESDGLVVEAQKIAGVTIGRGIVVTGANDTNFFAGELQVNGLLDLYGGGEIHAGNLTVDSGSANLNGGSSAVVTSNGGQTAALGFQDNGVTGSAPEFRLSDNSGNSYYQYISGGVLTRKTYNSTRGTFVVTATEDASGNSSRVGTETAAGFIGGGSGLTSLPTTSSLYPSALLRSTGANAFTALQTITTGTGTPSAYAPPASFLVNDLVTTDVTGGTGVMTVVADVTPPDTNFPTFIEENNALFTHGAQSIINGGTRQIVYRATATHRGTGHVSGFDGFDTHIGNQSLEQGGTAATVDTLVGFHAEAPDLGSAADLVTEADGLRIDGQSATGVANAFGINQLGASDKNFLAGSLQVNGRIDNYGYVEFHSATAPQFDNGANIYGGANVVTGNFGVNAGNITAGGSSSVISAQNGGVYIGLGYSDTGVTGGAPCFRVGDGSNNYYEYINGGVLKTETFGTARGSFANVRTLDVLGNQTNAGSVTGAGLVSSTGQVTGAGTAPTVTAGAGAGSTGSATLSGTNLCGVLTVTVSGTPATGTVGTLTLGGGATFPHQTVLTLTPGNAAAAGLATGAIPYATGTATTAVVTSGTTALPVGTYVYNYHLIGY